jgi:protein ImuA
MTASAAAKKVPAAPFGSARDRSVLRLLGAEAAAELAGHVGTARELERRRAERRRGAFPTGLAPLDRLLDGGLPRGALVELVGGPGSGRFAAVLATLAAATGGAGEAAALVDLGDHLDPQAAVDAGVDAARLLWLRPRRVGEALAAAEAVLQGGLPLVVVDLGTPPVPGGRGYEAGWVRLARAAQTHGGALLVASPYRVSGTAAQAVVAARPGRAVYAAGGRGAPPLLVGRETTWVLEKSRGRQGGEEERGQLVLAGARLPEVWSESTSTAIGSAKGTAAERREEAAAAERAARAEQGEAASEAVVAPRGRRSSRGRRWGRREPAWLRAVPPGGVEAGIGEGGLDAASA